MLVVVGGHSRNIGKTAVVAGLIRRLREFRWTALKITQYGHGVCSRSGETCECAVDNADHPVALSEEFEPNRTDSGRFLAAGAERSFWLRTPVGRLAQAKGTLDKIFAAGGNVIVESNSLLELARPDVFLMVLDFGCEDFKPSSLRFLDQADAYVVIDRGINQPLWAQVAAGRWDDKPQFLARPPGYVSENLASFVKARLTAETSSAAKAATRLRP
jgi:molybdopterin-guanine dinucleotide biosynthesis protein